MAQPGIRERGGRAMERSAPVPGSRHRAQPRRRRLPARRLLPARPGEAGRGRCGGRVAGLRSGPRRARRFRRADGVGRAGLARSRALRRGARVDAARRAHSPQSADRCRRGAGARQARPPRRGAAGNRGRPRARPVLRERDRGARGHAAQARPPRRGARAVRAHPRARRGVGLAAFEHRGGAAAPRPPRRGGGLRAARLRPRAGWPRRGLQPRRHPARDAAHR